MQSSSEIRQAFLDFFKGKGHEVVPSGDLVPQNDPTLMFVNAGMVPFKDVFTGKQTRNYTRATSSQKCIRISGKHNDLENVGVTARHHTFFEMLGNFSFGDYFKEDAITYAWEFLTKVAKLDPSRMVVTIFGGEDGLPPDEEAEAIWAKVSGYDKTRIIRCGADDNFWSMGDTGPCGPCTEIHYFIGDGDADPAKFGEEPGVDGKGWTEIWNNVFMQFDRQEDGTLNPLPKPCVDTGMGLERLCVVLQGVQSNYDTDLLRPIVDLAAEISGKTYGGTLDKHDVSMRVIADHARTTAFLISEGIFPDKSTREYVLRRVMRRAIRHADRLGISELFLHRCALKVVDLMGEQYPQLKERRALIEDITKQEEERFRATLRRGLELIEQNESWQNEGGEKKLPGDVAFKLFSTYGFPVDLQEVIGEEQGFKVDHKGFEVELEKDRAMSRAGGEGPGDKAVSKVYHELKESLPATEFIGYDYETGETKVLALVKDGARVKALKAGESGEVIVAASPFYAESGGQVGDTGEITVGDNVFEVTDTKKPLDGLWVHHGKMKAGALEEGADAHLEVNHVGRSATRRNHSATHLLHLALRRVVGPQAMQKGSLVGPDRLRFDYSASQPLTLEQIGNIEDMVNERVLRNVPINTDVLPMDEAKERGAMGIFEEKYGDVVRMLTIADSIELCGGTHAHRTGDIGFFKILSDSGLAAGVRRIEAATGQNSALWARETETMLGETAALLKGTPAQAKEKVQKLLEQQKALKQEIEDLKRKMMSGGSSDISSEAREVDGIKVLGAKVELGDAKALREMADQLRDKLAPAVILLGTEGKKGKVFLACSVSQEATKKFKAGDIVRESAAIVGGGGGGRPDFAQAGGSDPSKLGEAVAKVYEMTGA